MPWRASSATSAALWGAGMVAPVGFWNVVIAQTALMSCTAMAASSAGRLMPSWAQVGMQTARRPLDSIMCSTL